MRFALLLLMLFGFVNVRAMEPEFGNGVLHLTGEIRPGDYDKLISAFKKNPQEFVTTQTVYLNSLGGSVSEAIKLANFIRETSRVTFIDDDAKCMSACFFLFVAGGNRLFDTGKLGIHRPYYDPSEFKTLSASKAREAYEKLDVRVRQFLSDMRVPEEIVRQMFATPSSSIKLLSANEFERQIGSRQNWYDELAKSACPSQSFRCMAIKGRQDRLTMLKTYLGQSIAQEEAVWVTGYQKTLTADLQVLATTQNPAHQTRPTSKTPKLDLAHPGWERLVNTVEFSNWQSTLPSYIRNLATSENEDDAIRMIELFKKRGASTPAALYLSCDLVWSVGNSNQVHMDYVVDMVNKKIGINDAEITDEFIRSTGIANGRKSTVTINRRSGAISLFFDGLGGLEGKCARASEQKF